LQGVLSQLVAAEIWRPELGLKQQQKVVLLLELAGLVEAELVVLVC